MRAMSTQNLCKLKGDLTKLVTEHREHGAPNGDVVKALRPLRGRAPPEP